jgi:N6-L-threonylcarbamoyladenine synthase
VNPSPTRQVVLAIESSCDETAVAIVDDFGRILFERLWSQVKIHEQFGGVVPEVASRSHFDAVQILSRELESVVEDFEITTVAATLGPGLIGPLLVGSNLARGMALGLGVPFKGVHHLRGHVASVLVGHSDEKSLSDRAAEIYPAIVFLVSGGHTQILSVTPELHCRLYAETADDAAGECLDKCAKLMGLPYPGGPSLEKLAKTLDPSKMNEAVELSKKLPRPKSASGFSFSGLKTAFRLLLEARPELKGSPQLAWAIQDAVIDSLLRGLEIASAQIRPAPKDLVFCGGVAANETLRRRLEVFAKSHGWKLHLPPLRYATDNAVMIAVAAVVQDLKLNLETCEARIPLSSPWAESRT